VLAKSSENELFIRLMMRSWQLEGNGGLEKRIEKSFTIPHMQRRTLGQKEKGILVSPKG